MTNTSIRLSQMERIDLREVWSHEALDFTKWLSEEDNLMALSNAIGIGDISLEERESSVGRFAVDIFATEEDTGRKIIIENQLEQSDHDHLGKIITYASGKDAQIIIWIVKHACDEHRKAIEWLNTHTDESVDFFLVEIELWRIANSPYAPKFNIVEQPNNWAKSQKIVSGLSETKQLQLDFWQKFKDYAQQNATFMKHFSLRKAQPSHWYDLSTGHALIGITLRVNSQKNRIAAGLYIRGDKDLYNRFLVNRDQIESELGAKLEWKEASKDCQISFVQTGTPFLKQENWDDYFAWFCDKAMKSLSLVKRYAR